MTQVRLIENNERWRGTTRRYISHGGWPGDKECGLCGAVVANTDQHDKFHSALDGLLILSLDPGDGPK